MTNSGGVWEGTLQRGTLQLVPTLESEIVSRQKVERTEIEATDRHAWRSWPCQALQSARVRVDRRDTSLCASGRVWRRCEAALATLNSRISCSDGKHSLGMTPGHVQISLQG